MLAFYSFEPPRCDYQSCQSTTIMYGMAKKRHPKTKTETNQERPRERLHSILYRDLQLVSVLSKLSGSFRRVPSVPCAKLHLPQRFICSPWRSFNPVKCISSSTLGRKACTQCSNSNHRHAHINQKYSQSKHRCRRSSNAIAHVSICVFGAVWQFEMCCACTKHPIRKCANTFE